MRNHRSQLIVIVWATRSTSSFSNAGRRSAKFITRYSIGRIVDAEDGASHLLEDVDVEAFELAALRVEEAELQGASRDADDQPPTFGDRLHRGAGRHLAGRRQRAVRSVRAGGVESGLLLVVHSGGFVVSGVVVGGAVTSGGAASCGAPQAVIVASTSSARSGRRVIGTP